MFVQEVALGALPAHAEVHQTVVTAVLERMAGDARTLQRELDQGFRNLELRQPELAEFLAGQVAGSTEPAAQTMSYFLLVVIHRAFEEAFGARLGIISGAEIDRLVRRLIADGELRSAGNGGDSYSEDLVAIGQPALVRLLRGELDRIMPHMGVGPGSSTAEPLYEALLLEILALSHAVAPGHSGVTPR